MVDAVRVSRLGYTITLSDLNDGPLPADLIEPLTRQLCYTEREFVSKWERRKRDLPPDEAFSFNRVDLHSFDEHGRLWCGAGFTARVINYFLQRGCAVDHVIRGKWANPPRPDALVPDWDSLERRLEAAGWGYRARQKECLQAVADDIRCHLGCVVDAAAGFGKTELMMCVAALYPRANIAVVTPGESLVSRTHAKFVRWFGAVGRIDGKINRPGARITVYSADSLHKISDPRNVDLLLGDEAHLLVNNKRMVDLARYTQDTIRVGFTATVEGRSDGSDARLEPVFGRCVFRLPTAEATALGLIVPITVHWTQVGGDDPTQGIDPESTDWMRAAIWRNPVRNQAIRERARSYPDDEQTLILVNSLEHGIFLNQQLPEYALVYGRSDQNGTLVEEAVNCGMLAASVKPLRGDDFPRLCSAFEEGSLKKVIATSTWKTGISPDYLAALIWAASGQSQIDATQGPSRASRITSDGSKVAARLEDFEDSFTRRTQRWSRTRRSAYRKNGWEQFDLWVGSRASLASRGVMT